MFQNICHSDFLYIKVWLTDSLEREDKTNASLVYYIKKGLARQHYSVQLRDSIFVKGSGFLSFARILGKWVSENISKMLSTKYGQNFLIILNNLLQMHLKLFQKSGLKNKRRNR